MSDAYILHESAPIPAPSLVTPDNRTIFGDGTSFTPLTTRNGTSIFGSLNDELNNTPRILVLQTAAAYPIGTPMYVSAYNSGTGVTTLTQAVASAPVTSAVVGLLTEPSTGVGAASPDLQDGGLFVLTTAQWDAIVQGESGGLTPGALYFLNTNPAQKPITTTPGTSSTDTVAAIGVALSPTVMRLRLQGPVFEASAP